MIIPNITIQKMVYGGYGLGFVNGKAFFVPYAVPGDELSAQIVNDRKDYSFARVISITEASGLRIQPECPNFGICGGCDHLNIPYQKETEYKKEILEEALLRNSHNDFTLPPIDIIAGKREHYRSHASVKCNEQSDIGFYQRDTNTLIRFPESGCRLLQETLTDEIKNISYQIKKHTLKEIKIACSYDNKCISTLSEGDHVIAENENDLHYDRHINSFFQANRFLRKQMLDKVSEYADLKSTGSFLDIGCGVGFFTLHLAKKATTGYGIDINNESIKWADHNAKKNGIGNVRFETGPAEKIFYFKGKISTLIADPPRAGLSKKARNAVKTVDPERIVYVSCNPATFSRDIRYFAASGYSFEKLTLIDMFPGTHHIEVIGLLVKYKSL